MVNVQLFDVKPNLPIGIFHDFKYQLQELKMDKGDTLFLYTDGLTEAKNAEKKLLGREHVMELVSASAKAMTQSLEASPTQALVDSVVEQWKQFGSETEQSDDMTLLALYRWTEPVENLPLPVSLQALATVKATVFAAAGTGSAGKRALLACDEALANIVSYSGADQLCFSCRREGKQLMVEFRDNGIPFDPFAQRETPERAFEDLDQGGMGISLIKQSVSSAAWRNEEGYNILNMTIDL